MCVSVDYATDDTISDLNKTTMPKNIPKDTIVVNGSGIVGVNDSASIIVVKSSDKIYTTQQKKKYPTITMTGKPSCKCGRYSSYTWRTRTYINHCPHCHKYNVLYNAHKRPARFEQEITCKKCGADYCVNCGHEKYSWSKYYLREA